MGWGWGLLAFFAGLAAIISLLASGVPLSPSLVAGLVVGLIVLVLIGGRNLPRLIVGVLGVAAFVFVLKTQLHTGLQQALSLLLVFGLIFTAFYMMLGWPFRNRRK